jgi:hypothetical protein
VGMERLRGFREEHLPKSRYILDHHHLCEKVKERFGTVFEDSKRRRESQDELMEYLNSGEVDSALTYIDGLSKRFRNEKKLEALSNTSLSVMLGKS